MKQEASDLSPTSCFNWSHLPESNRRRLQIHQDDVFSRLHRHQPLRMEK
jgi:hypothetical protein